MRRRWIAIATVLAAGTGCGSSSGTDLFSNGPKVCAQGTLVSCTGDHDCVGHAPCGPNGAVGACACDQGAGGAAGTGGVLMGNGGIVPFGGSGGVGGFSSGGASGSFETGGFSPGTGGFVPIDASMGGQGGAQATCPVGHYSGTFKGTYGGLIKSNVSGTIEFDVDANGAVTGKYAGSSPNNGSKADLTGTVDCTSGSLDMRIENGTYPGVINPVKFTGTMPGTYTPINSSSWSGTWSITDDANQSGTGTWTAA